MFSRFSPLASIYVSQDRRPVQEGRRTRPADFRHTGRTRVRFRLEGLEDRCLLSGISAITEFSDPQQGSCVPRGITAGPDGNLWFTEPGANKIGMINPTTDAITEFPIPTANSGPAGITAGPDGNLWFTEDTPSKIGMINPTTHAITEFATPTGNSGPRRSRQGPTATSGSPRTTPTRSG